MQIMLPQKEWQYVLSFHYADLPQPEAMMMASSQAWGSLRQTSTETSPFLQLHHPMNKNIPICKKRDSVISEVIIRNQAF